MIEEEKKKVRVIPHEELLRPPPAPTLTKPYAVPVLPGEAALNAQEADNDFKNTESLISEIKRPKEPEIPGMLTGKYWKEVGKKLPGKLMEQSEGIPALMGEIDSRLEENFKIPTIPEMLLLGQPQAWAYKFLKSINAPQMGSLIWKGTVESWESMIRNPKRFIYERPGDFVLNLIDIAQVGAIAGAGAKVLKAAPRAARMTRIAKVGEIVAREGEISGKLYKTLIEDMKKSNRIFGPDGTQFKLTDENFKFLKDHIPDEARISFPKATVTPKGPQKIAPFADLDALSKGMQVAPQAKQRGFFYQALRESGVISPDFVMKDNKFSNAIWDEANLNDLASKRFLARAYSGLDEISQTIGFKKNRLDQFRKSPFPTAVGKIVDNELTVGEVLRGGALVENQIGLTLEEVAILKQKPSVAIRYGKFLQTEYDASYRTYGRAYLDKTKEAELWNKALALPKDKNTRKVLADKWINSLQTVEEQQMAKLYVHRNPSYLPHMWFKEEREVLQNLLNEARELLKNPTNLSPEDIQKITRDEKKIAAAFERKGQPNFSIFLDRELPKQLEFKNFKARKAEMPGYSFNSADVFLKYMEGISRKIYKEPVLRKALTDWHSMPGEIQEYTRSFLRHWIGYDRAWGREAGSVVKEIQFHLKLGHLNTRFPLQNYTQRINDVVELGEKRLAQGWMISRRAGIKKLFEKTPLLKYTGELAPLKDVDVRLLFETTGLKESAAEYFKAGGELTNVPRILRFFNNVSSWFVKTSEQGNLLSSFASWYVDGRVRGLSARQAYTDAIRGATKHHFRHGMVGIAPARQGILGAATQFWDWPAKQLQLQVRWWKEDPRKVIKWIALTEGAKFTFDELLGVDLSNSVGMGVNVGDVLAMYDNLAHEDFDQAWERYQTSGLPGSKISGGLIPRQLGPGVTDPSDFIGKFFRHEVTWDDALRVIMPSSLYRAGQEIKAVAKGPIGVDEKGRRVYGIGPLVGDEDFYKETALDLVRKPFFKPMTETKQQRERIQKDLVNKTVARYKHSAAILWNAGKRDAAMQFMKQHGFPEVWVDPDNPSKTIYLEREIAETAKQLLANKGKTLEEKVKLSKLSKKMLESRQ